MTKKTLGLSLIAASMLSTATYAGTLVINDGAAAETIAKEKVMVEDTNVSASGFTYTPTSIPAGTLANAVFKFTFSDAIVNTVTTANVYEVNASDENQSTLVGDNPTLSTNNTVLTFNAVDGTTYVTNNREYYIGNDANKSASTQAINIQVAETNTPADDVLTASASLWTGDSQVEQDVTDAEVILTSSYEYSADIATADRFNARIDASESFQKFYDNNVDGGTLLADSLSIDVTDTTLTYNMEPTSIQLYTTTTTDLNDTFTDVAYFNGANVSGVTAINDNNVTTGYTLVQDDANATVAYDLNLTSIGSVDIEKTVFESSVYLTKNGEQIAVNSGTAINAGAWTIYGYYAQIPNIVVNSNKTSYMNFTNTSAVPAAATFTFLPQVVGDNAEATGNQTCTVVSAVEIPANASIKFNINTVLAASSCTETTGNFAVEVAIPTEPDSVYGNAYVKNISANDFIVLPVYNTSTIAQ